MWNWISRAHNNQTKFTNMSVFGLTLLIAGLFLFTPSSAHSAPLSALVAPYPQSTVISGISWDWSTYSFAAPGSDLWPTTWANDGNVYTSWGDGGGFGGQNNIGRASLGFARLEGPASSYNPTNVWGGFNSENPAQFGGKTAGILAVDSTIYSWLNTQNGSTPDFELIWSDDNAATWNRSTWSFNSSVFAPAAFLNFGQGYAGARDNFVYFYGGAWGPNIKETFMGRVPKDQVKDKTAYEYFSGMSGGNPTWSAVLSDRKPVFTDLNSTEFNASIKPSIVYNAAIDRYILTSFHRSLGGLGIFDAPEPWGPWTTVYYSDSWNGYGNGGEGLNSSFPAKWMSADGLTMWNVFSGWDSGGSLGTAHDHFNIVEAKLTLASGGSGGGSTTPPADTTPPSIVGVSGTVSTVAVQFSEPVSSATANNFANYAIDNNVSVLSAILGSGNTVTLSTTDHQTQVSHTLSVNGVEDLAGNPIANAQASYTVPKVAVASMVTNISTSSGRTYLAETDVSSGDEIYIDRSFQFTNIPGGLIGSTYIKTANDDKTQVGNSFLSFDVDQNVDVYIIYDDRIASKPSWLQSFTDSGANVDIASSPHSVLVLPNQQGTIVLGGNNGLSGSNSMYSVMLRPAGDAGIPINSELITAATTVEVLQTVSVDLVLDKAPQGIAGFDLGLSMSSSDARISSAALAPEFSDINPGTSAAVDRIVGVDFGTVYEFGASNITLATLTIEGLSVGTADIVITVNQLDNDSGNQIQVSINTGSVTVIKAAIQAPPTLPGLISPAQDLDGDGKAEDVNGNGQLDYADVVALFRNLNSTVVQSNPQHFDFNGNGVVDMSDVEALYSLRVKAA